MSTIVSGKNIVSRITRIMLLGRLCSTVAFQHPGVSSSSAFYRNRWAIDTSGIVSRSHRITKFTTGTVLSAQGGSEGTTAENNNKKTAKNKKDRAPNPYAPTIRLPQTEFSQRANAVVREPEIQQFWKEHGLYERLSEEAAERGASRFVLHDGPPYANGDLHIGHALNKLLKDFINRYQCLRWGKQVHYVPGWDCHGLPIELKVLQQQQQQKKKKKKKAEGEDVGADGSGSSDPLKEPIQIRRKAAEFAREAVGTQSLDFQRYGVMGNFDKPYMTLQPSFEAAQIEVFGKMVEAGYIYRGRKPVHWSPSSRTALAEAELEYPPGHVSTAVYVGFEVEQPSPALAAHVDNDDNKMLKVAIWTTTPWTLPANLAVAVNPDLTYAVVEHPSISNGDRLLVAYDLVDTLAKKFGLGNGDEDTSSFTVIATLTGAEVVGTTYRHPLPGCDGRVSPVVAGGDYITTESGTGLVHTAPGHGQEDYKTGQQYGLGLLSPVDDAGCFTVEAGPDLVGLSVLGDGNKAVLDILRELPGGNLLLAEDYGHKYPYDWRTKKPTIFRATDQWFASVEAYRTQTLDAIDQVRWVPDTGKNRITSFVSGRGDWCISRQRSWGVPIPVFYDRATGSDVLLDEHTLKHVKEVFAEHGSDAWWTMEEAELLPERYRDDAHLWVKGTDTMDVWFDSGSSWAGVLGTRSPDELAYPADLYLEGSDQHRGWFQSSLLTSVAVNGVAPYKTVLTHGFVLDEKGYKMSKSLGNVISPTLVIEGGNNKKKQPAYGADVLRLWVASSDYTSDVCIGDGILAQTFESYRKLRNTARYMVGNLYDYDPDLHEVPYDDLPSLDKWMLGRLSSTLKVVDEAHLDYQFYRAVQELLRFSTADLSNFYLDVAKDRLYVSGANDFRRRSCQTVIHNCLTGFAKAMAPILPHLAEDLWQNWKKPPSSSSSSVFQGGWPEHLTEYPPHDEDTWTGLMLGLRDDVNRVLERARAEKVLGIGASLDAAAFLYVEDTDDSTSTDTKRKLEVLVGDSDLIYPPVKTNGVDELRTVLMLSQVTVVDSRDELEQNCDSVYIEKGLNTGIVVGIAKARGTKCERCWFYDERDVSDTSGTMGSVCQRCAKAISDWEQETDTAFVLDIPSSPTPTEPKSEAESQPQDVVVSK